MFQELTNLSLISNIFQILGLEFQIPLFFKKNSKFKFCVLFFFLLHRGMYSEACQTNTCERHYVRASHHFLSTQFRFTKTRVKPALLETYAKVRKCQMNTVKLDSLKVSEFQNVLLVSSFGAKYQRKKLTNSALESKKW